MGSLFSVPIYFVIFRETTEAAVIVSVLLSFLSQVLIGDDHMKKRLSRQVWAGTALGLLISIAVGAAFIVIWNKYGNNLWASSEGIWVGVFSLVAVVMITVMGLAMLRTTQMQEKWKVKLSKAMNEENQKGFGNASRRYSMFILPLITVLREGLEAIVFIGGVTFTTESKSIPLAVVVGLISGFIVGYILYRGGNRMNLHIFFTASTCLLLLLAAGLVARAVASFEAYVWGKLTNAQSDDGGTYDPRYNVWALTCCDPKNNDSGGWQLFNAIFGWSNIGSIGSVVCYIGYWLIVIVALVYMKLKRRRVARANALRGVHESSNNTSGDKHSFELEDEKVAPVAAPTPAAEATHVQSDAVRQDHPVVLEHL
ncbi:high-affinity iron permease [Linnemannia gamsii]|uniref:High-affinity iron permease n=1 Tax=Linnemannia gamsii TaxID=64522 RepID=A0ABQ7K8M7_9FUNG|nr:high-affinity iron permease [Linnemannia gamsii]